MTWSKRVFIAEDDRQIVDLLRIRLELAGYHTSYAYDGVNAIRAIFTYRPDVIVLDIGLPLRDGFEVLREIRRYSGTKRTPVLMLTARHGKGDVQHSLLCGAQDYLVKPFDDRVLLTRIDRVLRDKGIPITSDTGQEYDVG